MILDIVGNVGIFHLHRLCSHKVALHFSIQTVSHQFKHNVGIAIDTWTLPLLGQLLENLIHISHVEVSTEAEVLRLPIVTAKERMNILNTTLASSTVAQMSHIEFTGKRKFFLSELGISQLLWSQILEVGICITKNLGNSILTFSTLTEHILMSRFATKLDTSHTSTFLATVVLLLHHQIEFVEGIHPSAILLLVIFQRFE